MAYSYHDHGLRTRKCSTESIEESSENTQQEWKKKAPWSSSSSSQTNQICLEQSGADLAQHLIEYSDTQRERKRVIWPTASNLDQARAGLAQHLEASVKPKEEKEWKPSRWNPVKPNYKKAAEWLGTTLDEVLEDDSEIDQEHLSRGHLNL